MNCLSQMINHLSYALERLGLYEPVIHVEEARERLCLERKIWEKFQYDRDALWKDFQSQNQMTGQFPPLVEKALTLLENHNIHKGIAVDLGCGINSTTLNLLERGWKVYAVDRSNSVIQTLTQKISSMEKKWIANGQLILVNQAIEEFDYPENVALVIATDALPYSDPEKINDILLKVKNALLPKGVLACNLFPYNDKPILDYLHRNIFGAWMTTKNVVEAVMRSVDFSSWSVTEGRSPMGIAKQFHIIAQR